jgi:hypothetical protein
LCQTYTHAFTLFLCLSLIVCRLTVLCLILHCCDWYTKSLDLRPWVSSTILIVLMLKSAFTASSCQPLTYSSQANTNGKLISLFIRDLRMVTTFRISYETNQLTYATGFHLSLHRLTNRPSRATRRHSWISRMRPPDHTTERCQLLELPDELRNIIYQNVLTHPRGLISIPEDELGPGFIPHSGIGRGARGAKGQYPNPLQYVCCQLHYETKNLLLKHNSCVFKGEREAIYKKNR